MTIEFRDLNNKYIKQWTNWNVIPNKDDTIRLHWGDNIEIEESYIVVKRIITGIEPEKLICIIKPEVI